MNENYKDKPFMNVEDLANIMGVKHKTAMKNLWEFMIDSREYGVTQNVVLSARVPRETLEIDGKTVKVSKVPYRVRSYTIEEMNYTLNDALQNEYDKHPFF